MGLFLHHLSRFLARLFPKIGVFDSTEDAPDGVEFDFVLLLR